MSTQIKQRVPLSILMELRDCIEEVRTSTVDDKIWRPLNRAAAIVKGYLLLFMPDVEVTVNVEDDVKEKVAQ